MFDRQCLEEKLRFYDQLKEVNVFTLQIKQSCLDQRERGVMLKKKVQFKKAVGRQLKAELFALNASFSN